VDGNAFQVGSPSRPGEFRAEPSGGGVEQGGVVHRRPRVTDGPVQQGQPLAEPGGGLGPAQQAEAFGAQPVNERIPQRVPVRFGQWPFPQHDRAEAGDLAGHHIAVDPADLVHCGHESGSRLLGQPLVGAGRQPDLSLGPAGLAVNPAIANHSASAGPSSSAAVPPAIR